VATAAAATGEAVAMAAGEAAATSAFRRYFPDVFRLVLGLICISLELLKTPSFPFASCLRVQYR
jgi:hypothetical protein